MVYIHVTHMDTIRLKSEMYDWYVNKSEIIKYVFVKKKCIINIVFFVKCIINIVFLKIKLNDNVSCFIYQFSSYTIILSHSLPYSTNYLPFPSYSTNYLPFPSYSTLLSYSLSYIIILSIPLIFYSCFCVGSFVTTGEIFIRYDWEILIRYD